MTITLENIGDGTLPEKFERELERVFMNIIDAKTDWKTARKIVITVKIKPDVERNVGAVETECKSVLAPAPKGSGMLRLKRNAAGEISATVEAPTPLPFEALHTALSDAAKGFRTKSSSRRRNHAGD